MSAGDDKNRVTDNAKVLGRRLEDLAVDKMMDDKQEGSINGFMPISAIAANTGLTPEEKKKKKEQEDAAYKHAMDAMSDRMAALGAELDKIDKGLDAIAQLRELKRTGKFDANNKDHMQLLLDAGVKIGDMIDSSDRGLDKAEDDFNKRRREVEAEGRELVREAQDNGLDSPAKDKLERKLQNTEAAVAHMIWDKEGASQEAKNVATKVNTEVAYGSQKSSVASALEGGSYSKKIEGTDLDQLADSFNVASNPPAKVQTAFSEPSTAQKLNFS